MKCLKIKDILLNINPEKVPVGTNPYIEIGDIDVSNKTYQYKDKKSVSGAKYALKNSIVVSTVRPTRGAIAIIQEDKIAVSNAFAIINVDEKQCNYKYLFYMINNNKFYDYLGLNSKGATYPTCSREDVYNYEITLPSLEEQNKIVKIFDNIFTSIDIKNKQIDDFNQLIKSQFIEMFGNYKEYGRLEEYTTLITKGASPRWQGINYSGEGTLFVTSENVREGFIDVSNPKYLENKINDILPRSVLKKNDILINIVGASIGRAAIYKLDNLANINQAVSLVRTKNINNEFLLIYLNSENAYKQYEEMKKGGARDNLSLKNISDLLIPIVPLELQNKFADIVKQIYKQKFEFEKQLEKLKGLQESLMKEYFG